MEFLDILPIEILEGIPKPILEKLTKSFLGAFQKNFLAESLKRFPEWVKKRNLTETVQVISGTIVIVKIDGRAFEDTQRGIPPKAFQEMKNICWTNSRKNFWSSTRKNYWKNSWNNIYSF